jgi:hypothetical protein
MAVFADKTFRGSRIELDGNDFHNCVFIDCQLIYSGGTVMGKLATKGCMWEFRGAALNTMHFIRANGIPVTAD